MSMVQRVANVTLLALCTFAPAGSLVGHEVASQQ
jgi:hypothetical protein